VAPSAVSFEADVAPSARPAPQFVGTIGRAPADCCTSSHARIVPAVADARAPGRVAADLIVLTKPRIVLMVLVTAIVGYHAAPATRPDWARLIHLLLGTALAAGGTLALNQYVERDVDGLMERTRRRPLPAGRLTPGEALAFAGTLTVAGIVHLAATLGALAAAVTAATSVLYLAVYTPLKRRTPLSTLAGAVAGALPPLTGWIAASDGLDTGAWVLFGIVGLWQLPHTLAIATLYREDYARAGICFLPVVDAEGTRTRLANAVSSVALAAVSLLPALVGLAGPVYLAGAFSAGVVLIALGVVRADTPRAATRRLLIASLLYLPIVLGLLALDAR
jgi:heme o synthase